MNQVKILLLAANPSGTDNLKLDEEIRSIDHAMRKTEFRDRFDFKPHMAVRIDDLQEYLLRHKPHIVHFSGHGDIHGEIILADETGNATPVPSRALSNLFSVLKDNIRCVVLNACYSETQGKAIAEHIDCVIGMSNSIGDEAAIKFAAAFYQALGYGRSIKIAFDLGCLQIDLNRLPEQDTPKLIANNCNPEDMVFAQTEYDFVLQQIEECFNRWKDANYLGYDKLIKHDEFLIVNKYRTSLASFNQERLAFLLRCAVQHGPKAEWGNWLLFNKDNKLIVYPLLITLTDIIAGQKPRWRAAYILECTLGNQLQSIGERLFPEVCQHSRARQIFQVMAQSSIVEHLEELAQKEDKKTAVDATKVLNEIQSFSKQVTEYRKTQTIKSSYSDF